MNLRLNTNTMTTSTTLFDHSKYTSWPNRKHQIRKQAVLTYAEADALLHYDPETGIFARKVRMGRMAKGTRADVPARSGYRVINLFRERYIAQRVAWLLTHGEWPPIGVVVEHKNLDKAHNAAENHRLASYSQNMANTPMRKQNKSGYKGVIKLPASKRTGEHTYRAEIQHEGNRVAVSGLECPVQAAFAYRIMAEMLFGEFARAA